MDKETGLYYAHARYYSSNDGMMISTDSKVGMQRASEFIFNIMKISELISDKKEEESRAIVNLLIDQLKLYLY